MRHLLLLLILSTCAAISYGQTTDTCRNILDTAYTIHFSLQSETTADADFKKLISFITNKGEFKPYKTKENQLDTASGNSVRLTHIRCGDSYMHASMEIATLENITFRRMYMKSSKPVKGSTDLFPKMDVTQLSFTSNKERDEAFQLIERLGWSDPVKKWRDYRLVKADLKIYILESYVTAFSETTQRYAKYLETAP